MVGALFGKSSSARGVTAARRNANEILEFVNLAEKADVPAHSLNVPERKRLEIARALAMKPKLLLLDEVMAGLNPTEIATACDLIKRIRDRKITIMVIEHVMKAIVTLSDRIVVLHHGEKIAEETPDAVMSDQRVIKAYLGNRYGQTAGARVRDN